MAADLKLIGAGFGRTGTDSMRDALEMIGYGPCHHMKVIVQNDAQRRKWVEALIRGSYNWDDLLEGFTACVDWPTAQFWPELIRAFPQAKVLLTQRDADSWWASFEKTILKSIRETTAEGRMTPGTIMTGPLVFRGQEMTRENCTRIYLENIARVKAEVPQDRLHIQTLGDGWDGLCAFLGVDVPNVPFPRTNSTRDFANGWPTQG